MSQTTQPHTKSPAALRHSENGHHSPVATEHGEITHLSGIAPKESPRRLILTLEGKVLREIPLTGSNISIGRRHGNDLQLNDLTLSGHHAQISCVPDYVFIEDLGSTNGTLVNGNHVKKVSLEQGDIIQIGHHQLTYIEEADKPYEPTMFIKAEYDETQFIYTDKENPPVLKGLALAGLRTISHKQTKLIMELRKTYNTIGFQGKRIALLTRGSEGYYITSVCSSKSRRAADIPQLNGQPISTELTLLSDKDIITIAGFNVQFYFLE
jgi:pSer/pThr/pTyr-binding forkhead associated (FHA) protein